MVVKMENGNDDFNANDLPTTRDKVRRLVHAGERRRDHLRAVLEAPAKVRGEKAKNPRALEYDRAELNFVEAGIAALLYHQSTLRPETSPALTLSELVTELDRLEIVGQCAEHDTLARIVTRARRILEELRS